MKQVAYDWAIAVREGLRQTVETKASEFATADDLHRLQMLQNELLNVEAVIDALAGVDAGASGRDLRVQDDG